MPARRVVLALALALSACSPRTTQKGEAAPADRKPGEAAPADWSKAGRSLRVGDVEVDCPWASPQIVFGCGNLLVVKLRLKNTGPAKIVRFAGWHGPARLADEHGNAYAPHDFGSGFRGFQGPLDRDEADVKYNEGSDTDDMLAHNLPLHPGKSYITYLFFEPPADVSKEARLTLPASALGGEGVVRLRVPISR